MRSRTLVASVVLVLASIGAGPAAAQVNEQRSGTIISINGPTLVLRTATPPARRVTLGVAPSPAPSLTLEVDLENAPASQWVFLRLGERISVVGVPSADGQRFVAVAVIGGAGPPRAPEAP